MKAKSPNFGSMPPFTLSAPRCPKCGEYPRGMQVTIAGSAHMYTDDKGKTFEYNGHVQIGSEYTPRAASDGQSYLICGGGHRWKSTVAFVYPPRSGRR